MPSERRAALSTWSGGIAHENRSFPNFKATLLLADTEAARPPPLSSARPLSVAGATIPEAVAMPAAS